MPESLIHYGLIHQMHDPEDFWHSFSSRSVILSQYSEQMTKNVILASIL